QIQGGTQRCTKNAPTNTQCPPGFRLLADDEKLLCRSQSLKENKSTVCTGRRVNLFYTKQEAGSRKQEAGSKKQEAGSKKQEARRRERFAGVMMPVNSTEHPQTISQSLSRHARAQNGRQSLEVLLFW
ncbi:MAG: hypothetical protein P4L43_00910, partial [Syntrophobacteraceae bacterium]|nr:hypothetical protein [Syntrophobacteraceae bacterium]